MMEEGVEGNHLFRSREKVQGVACTSSCTADANLIVGKGPARRAGQGHLKTDPRGATASFLLNNASGKDRVPQGNPIVSQIQENRDRSRAEM